MNAKLRNGCLTAAVVLASLLAVPQATAQTSTAPAAAADAYALDVDAKLTTLNVAVDRGPLARSSQEFPPQGEVDEAEVFATGEIPAGGTLVQNIGVLQSAAGANGQPLASAVAQTVDVKLLAQGGTPLISADVLKAVSTTDCISAPSAAGTDIVGLKVGGVDVPVENTAPNTPVADAILNPLGLRMIVNEQHQTADGRGLVVNALHIYNYSPPSVPIVTPLFVGDIIVSHAMSTVNCPNGAGSTGGNNDIYIVKNADKATARPGDEVTYTATVQNKSGSVCNVNQLIDHLPVAFEFVSTAGDLGTTATTAARPVGGQDIIIKPTGVSIPAGGTLTQTFVVKVKDAATPGTYFNNVEILCSNIGNWVKGLDAPVRVPGNETTPPPTKKPQCDDGKDNDGDGKIDFPADPGCHSKQDDSEIDEHPRTGGRDLSGIAALLLVGAFLARRRMATV